MNILVTGALQNPKVCIDKIQKLGHSVFFLQYENESLPCSYDDIDAVIGNGLFLSHPIQNFKNLKYIQLTSVGYDRVPLDYIKRNNIKINNARGVYSIPMAEFVLSGVLQIYKKNREFYDNQRNHIWEKKRELLELFGKKVCIVGCGSVGQECAKRFKAFGCNIIGIDNILKVSENFDEVFRIDYLDECLHIADIIVLSIPLVVETKHLINEKNISYIKQGSVLVNVSRGEIVQTNALLEALKNKLLGAVLDVFEEEPLDPQNPLWDQHNVFITPHNSFIGENNEERLHKIIIDNLRSYKWEKM